MIKWVEAWRASRAGRSLNKLQGFLVNTVLNRVLIPVFLFIVYFAGFGVMSLLVRLARPGLLRRTHGEKGSYWIKAQGYEADPLKCRRQS
jgi:hypothetical protein